MRRAIKLARKGNASPNPQVGCVIVKKGKIIAEGYHKKAGLPHAEVDGLKKLKKNEAQGSTMYVTLEPCCHFGRTPPCTDAIIKAGVKKVYAAMKDPNSLVSGKGMRKLKKAGIKVDVGLLEKDAIKLNEAYIHHAKTGLPFATLKTAMSLDGKIATSTGESKWITSEKAREKVHEIRSRTDAILVGVGTVITDNPQLTSRIKGGRDPLRIIVDSRLRIPLNANVFKDGKIVVATTLKHNKTKKRQLDAKGVDVWVVQERDGHLDLADLMRVLGEVGVTSVLIEGGGEVNASALEAGIVNKIMFFIAPKIIGGRDAKTPVEGNGIKKIKDALKLENTVIEKIGDDFLVTSYLK